jgi:chromosome partitioning protein
MALSAADYALIPVPCDFFATRGLMRLSELIEVVRTRTNPRLAQWMFVTLYDGRTRVSQRILAELQGYFGAQLLATVIQADTRVRESALVGEPVTHFAPNTRASRQYRELAAELLTRIQPEGADA